MSDAFVYMFVVGAGASSGVAVVGMATYKIFMMLQGRPAASTKNRKKNRGVI